MTRRRNIFRALLAMVAVALLAVPVALAAPNGPEAGQRVDLKVLVLSPVAGDAVTTAWQGQLDRVGVPYSTYTLGTSAPITDATLADYANKHAYYQAVVVAAGDMGLSAAETAALSKFEATFGVRQISENTYPSATRGVAPTTPGAPYSDQGNQTATLTATGLGVFPYLKGPVPIASPAPGVQATPTSTAYTSLLNAPSGSSYMGIYTRPDGTQEIVSSLTGNDNQSHFQLLRDGMLNWVTRGVYLGYSRNYLGLDVDDIFLGDDLWNPTTHTTDYTANKRMSPVDVDTAVAWEKKTGLQLNMVYNLGGSLLNEGTSTNNGPITGDPLVTKFQSVKNDFRWINHTYQHPNLDCTSTAFTAAQITNNQALFQSNFVNTPPALASGLNDPTELVTGEHSGLANLIPGNPGTLDPPDVQDAAPTTPAPATLNVPADSYVYGVSARTAAGSTPIAITPDATAATTGATANTVTWDAACNATGYDVYRHVAAAGITEATPGWVKLNTTPIPQSTATAFDPDVNEVTFTDNQATGTAATLTAENTATKPPYRQNPNLIPALTAAGIKSIASDTSKPYPNPPTSATVSATAADNFAPGSTWVDGPAQVVPRYPTNVYYNVANRAAQLDEYNFIYRPVASGGGCIASSTNTCRTVDATWPEYLASESSIVERTAYGNDPRPHYFHQTNLADANINAADTDTNTGGIAYALVNTVLKDYDTSIDRASAPIIQIPQAAAARMLVTQAAWKAAKNNMTAYVQDDKIHITSPVTQQVPVTGSTVGDDYAGNRSAWIAMTANTERVLDLKTPITVAAAPVAPTTTQSKPAAPASGAVKGSAKSSARPSLTHLKLSHRKFGRARRGLSTRKSSTRISWKLNRVATVHLVVQAKIRVGRTRTTKGRTKWQSRGTITVRNAKAGTSSVLFKGRLRKQLIGRGSYRVVATATAGGKHSKAKHASFAVVKR